MSGSDVRTEPFRWSAATGMVGLGHLPGNVAVGEARDVSADGSIVVGIDAAHSFVWSEATGMRDLETFLFDFYALDLGGWDLGEVRAISADGRTLVGTGTNPSGRQEAWRIQLSAFVPEPGTALLVALGIATLGAARRRA